MHSPSPPAVRNFHKALKEFRRVEAEAAEVPKAPKLVPVPGPVPAPGPVALASSRESAAVPPRVGHPASDSFARMADSRVLAAGRPSVQSV
jgi:hypothetical protein